MHRLFSFLFLFLCLSAYGQQVTWGEAWKTGSHSVYQKVLGVHDDMIFALRIETPMFRSRKFHVDVISMTNHQWERSFLLQLPLETTTKQTITDAGMIGGKIVLFVKFRREGEPENFAVHFVSTNGTLLEKKVLTAFTLPCPSIHFGHTLHQSKGTLLTYVHARNLNQPGYTLYVSAFNNHGTELWNETLNLPEGRPDQVPAILEFDELGHLFFMAHSALKDEKGTIDPNSQNARSWSMFHYSRNDRKLREMEINLGSKWVNAVTLKLDEELQPIVAGFYSGSRKNTIDGTFFMRMDPSTGFLVHKSMMELDKNELLPASSFHSKKNDQLASFYFDHMLVMQDGGVSLIAEKYYTLTNTYLDPRTNLISYTNNYYYNEILVIRTDKEGNIQWSKVIPKRQYSSNDGGVYSSYALFQNENDHIHFLFNDHPDNLKKNRPHIRFMNRPARSVLAHYVINPDGRISSQELLSHTGSKTVMLPRLHYVIPKTGIVCFGQRNRNVRFGTVTWNK